MSDFPTTDQLHGWLKQGNTQAISQLLAESHPLDIARLLEPLDDQEIWAVIREAALDDVAAAFSHLPMERQASLISVGQQDQAALLISKLSPDDRTDLIKSLKPDLAQQLLAHLSESQRLETERLARYPENTVGSVMSPDFAAVPADITASEALDLIRLEAPRKETVYAIYVMDEQSRLIGIVSLKDLILAQTNASIASIMDTEVVHVSADEPREVAAEQVQAYDLLALPVTDHNGTLVGIVTVDDVLDVQQAEATTDFHKMGATGLMTMSLRDAGLLVLYRARVPWLLALVFVNVFSGEGIAYFEDTIVAVASLVFFLPLLIDSGGNAGSQAATLMVRAMAVGDVKMRDWFSLLTKEVSIALLLGLTMAVGVVMIASYRSPEIIVPVGLTMVCTVVFGSLVGMSLPFLLARLKLDPATASAPLITSIADIGGVLIYFSIATWWLGDMIRAAAEANGA